MRKYLPTAIVLSLAMLPIEALHAKASQGVRLSAIVPTICKVVHRGTTTQQGTSFALGQIFEYCNAPTGFRVTVDYEPGSLRGTSLQLGSHSIVLDGSGHNEILHADGPQINSWELAATPSASGFDASVLQVHIEVA